MENSQLLAMLTTRRSQWSTSSRHHQLNQRKEKGYPASTVDSSISNEDPLAKSRKVPCYFHPVEKVTNFCRERHCLLPLCPKCIQFHSEEHRAMGIFGSFSEIQQVYREVCTFLKTATAKVNNIALNIGKEREKFEEELLYQKDKISTFRGAIHNQIDEIFNDCQKEWEALLFDLNEGHFDSMMNLQEASKLFTEELQAIQSKVNTGGRLMEGIIRFFEVDQQWKKLLSLIQTAEGQQINFPRVTLDSSKLPIIYQDIAHSFRVDPIKEQPHSRPQPFPNKSRSCVHLWTFKSGVQKDLKIQLPIYGPSSIRKINQQYPLRSKITGTISEKLRIDNFISPLDAFSLKTIHLVQSNK